MTHRRRVVVVGSGAAGLTAAVAAATEGADVTVLEAAGLLGGTTGISGGGIWIPANPWAAAAGVDDGPDEALRYLRALDLGDCDEGLAHAYVREGARVVRAIEDCTPLRWQHLVGWPDYHPDLAGGKALGRSLEVAPVRLAPDVVARVRPDRYRRPTRTINEEASAIQPDAAELATRDRDGVLVQGRGLVGGLYAALQELGGSVRTGVRVRSLLTRGDAVVGVEADGDRFEGNVVVATGGFEWDAALASAFLRGPLLAPGGPPTNRGDGLRMSMAVGAALGNMSEAWWSPAMEVPGETFDDAPFFRLLFLEPGKPGSLVVDSGGRRFANEATNYNDFGRALHAFDAASYRHPAVPSWMVLDAECRATGVGPLTGADPDPDWLVRADTVERVGETIGVEPAVLRETVDRFNDHAAVGVDPEFGRGSYDFDRLNPVLAGLRPLTEPPFYAVRVIPGCLGTKGGVVIDEHGRVLRADTGGPIPGLHAAGNASANLFGCAYPGPGATIGPALVFGWSAGKSAAA